MLFLITTPVTDARLLTGSCKRKSAKSAVFFLATVEAQCEQVAGEYCMAMTRVAGRSRCGRSGSGVLESEFQLDS